MRRGAKGPDDSSGDELDEFGKGSSHSASNSGIKFWTWDQEKVVTEVLSCLVLNVLNSVMYKCMDILIYCRFSDARFKFIDHWKMDVDEWIDEMR